MEPDWEHGVCLLCSESLSGEGARHEASAKHQRMLSDQYLRARNWLTTGPETKGLALRRRADCLPPALARQLRAEALSGDSVPATGLQTAKAQPESRPATTALPPPTGAHGVLAKARPWSRPAAKATPTPPAAHGV